jgi:hypothetical protein
MNTRIKQIVNKIPVIGKLASFIYCKIKNPLRFTTSSWEYWDERYRRRGNSGAGSYNRLAEFKACVINELVQKEHILTVIEFGCGDGNQLKYFNFPAYIGFDVSRHAVSLCKKNHKNGKEFKLMSEYSHETADLTLSLDVIYHLIEDSIYENYMHLLFNASNKFVVIYASNYDEVGYYPDGKISHVRHRKFTDWIEKNAMNFSLIDYIPNQYPFDAKNPDNTSFANFYIFKK